MGPCSSPLCKQPCGPALQVPTSRLHSVGMPGGRFSSSGIQWTELNSMEPVGSGGFGSVYRAEYRGDVVALKRVKKCTKNQLASRQSFWAELNAAHLQHRNIVRVLAATTCVPAEFADEGSLGTVLMEFVDGRNLQQVIYEIPEPLGPERWLRYAADIAQGLRFLHAHNVVHLDIKPANVLLSDSGVCKVADFGCSVRLEPGFELSAASPRFRHIGGTYTHRSPELLRGEVVSTKADIFSFGITLWQLVTREQPYTGDRQHVMYAVVARDLRPSLQGFPVFCSEQGRRCGLLLSCCWNAEASCRPSAQEVLLHLEQLQPEYN